MKRTLFLLVLMLHAMPVSAGYSGEVCYEYEGDRVRKFAANSASFKEVFDIIAGHMNYDKRLLSYPKQPVNFGGEETNWKKLMDALLNRDFFEIEHRGSDGIIVRNRN